MVTSSLPLRLGSLGPGELVLVWVPSLGHIEMFKNYSYSIAPCAKNAKKQQQKQYKYEGEMNVIP